MIEWSGVALFYLYRPCIAI